MMKPFIFILSLLFGICACQSAVEVKSTAATTVKEKQPVSLSHLIRHPNPTSKNPPVIIILHGVGANEKNLHNSLAPYFDPRFLVISLRSPLELGPNAYGWYPVRFSEDGVVVDIAEEEQGRQALLKVIDEIIAYYEVDKNKVFLLGFSQGAIMSAAVAMTAPEKIRGAVLLSGQIPKSALDKVASNKDIQKVDLFISHGKNDRVLPIQDGRLLKAKLVEVGGKNLIYKEHDGAHQLDGTHLREILAWLAQRL